ncbi:uncharacterized protein LOC122078787 [Macadamia integrifolia]|uniref:uncharacterized protein LOC122078787 n=1 Tax=Macadamia integrifolia TaxID=60698 RepID=UPI001C4EA351|nr:uncharacterized protein LOC122078787 [Macadamia integrifolia]
MMEVVAVASFPVVFFNGEREIELGNVEIHPSLGFKKLQSVICQMIGISPHQISISLIREKVSRSSDKRRRLPVTDKTDFAAIVKEEDCFLYIKRLKKERRGKLRQSMGEKDYLSHPIAEKMAAPEKILRRDPGTKPPQYGLVSPYFNQITSPEFLYRGERLGFGLVDYENQLQNLQAQREKYLMSTAANPYAYRDWEDGYMFERPNGRNQAVVSNVVCQVCSAANGKPTAFHWCVYDTVTVGFRSPAGPVARPTKVKNKPCNLQIVCVGWKFIRCWFLHVSLFHWIF